MPHRVEAESQRQSAFWGHCVLSLWSLKLN